MDRVCTFYVGFAYWFGAANYSGTLANAILHFAVTSCGHQMGSVSVGGCGGMPSQALLSES